jgi:hypothetical protein
MSLLSLVGCGKDINNKDAVRAAIAKRVGKTFNLNDMEVNVTNVSFHDQDAVATVAFVPKGGAPQNAVTFKYNLHRQKDEWIATGLAQGGTNMAAHSGAAGGVDATEGAPTATPGPIDPSKPLPAGHPPIGSSK